MGGNCSKGLCDFGVSDGGVADLMLPLLLKGKGSQEYIVLFGGGLMQTRYPCDMRLLSVPRPPKIDEHISKPQTVNKRIKSTITD